MTGGAPGMEWVGPGMLLNTPGRPPPQSPWCPASGPGLWQAPGGGRSLLGGEGSYHAHEAGVVQQARDVEAADPSCLWG